MMGKWLARLKTEKAPAPHAREPRQPPQGDGFTGFLGFQAYPLAPFEHIEREQTPANDAPAVDNTTGQTKLEAYEERAAIMEFMGGIERSEAERLAASYTWPNSQAMNPGEVDTFTARLARFTDKGVSYDDAERLADALVIRDREGDDRRLCLECVHLQGTGRWRCGNAKRADVAQQGLARDLVLMLQRCPGYRKATPT
jgi:hypothetical protein